MCQRQETRMNIFYLKQNNENLNNYSKALNILHRLVIAFSFYIVFGLLFQHVYADERQVNPYQTKHGSVWLQAADGTYSEAIQMQTDVDYAITGAIARATIKQKFINSSDFWAEGIYVFPLPEKATNEISLPVLAKASINTEACLPFSGPECGACIDFCPVDGALTLDMVKPVIDQEMCTGCALCREACITEPKAINIASL